jgi:glutaredoxin
LLWTPVQAEVYRQVDGAGGVQYSDRPAPDAERLRFGAAPLPDEALPYETRRAQQNFPVTLYVFEACGDPCQQARKLLNARGIPFAEKNIATQAELEAFRKLSGSDQAPTLRIGNTWLKGLLAAEWQQELDLAGYPKTAPYRPQTAPTR